MDEMLKQNERQSLKLKTNVITLLEMQKEFREYGSKCKNRLKMENSCSCPGA